MGGAGLDGWGGAGWVGMGGYTWTFRRDDPQAQIPPCIGEGWAGWMEGVGGVGRYRGW